MARCSQLPTRSPSYARPPTRAARALRDGEPSGPEPSLDRPPKPELGDYSSNAAMLLAAPLGENPRDVAARLGAELERDSGAAGEHRADRGRRPRLRQRLPRRRLVPARDGRPGRAPARASARPRPPRRNGSWSSSSPPTRPGRCTSAAAATPPTATPWCGCWRPSATMSARVLRQRWRRPDRALRAIDRRPDERRRAARGRLQRRVRRRARRADRAPRGSMPGTPRRSAGAESS